MNFLLDQLNSAPGLVFLTVALTAISLWLTRKTPKFGLVCVILAIIILYDAPPVGGYKDTVDVMRSLVAILASVYVGILVGYILHLIDIKARPLGILLMVPICKKYCVDASKPLSGDSVTEFLLEVIPVLLFAVLCMFATVELLYWIKKRTGLLLLPRWVYETWAQADLERALKE